MCNESLRDMSWEAQCRLVAAAGYTGIEIAPFTLVKEGVHELESAKRREMRQVLKANGLSCAGLHWLLAPPPFGLHITHPDAEIRKKTIAYLNQIIDFCGDLDGPVMVFGSPKQRSTVDIPVAEAKKYLAEGLATVADHAQKRGTLILLESLDSSQTDVVNTLAEAAEMLSQINHPAIRTLFDFHNTGDEVEPFEVLVRKYAPMIRHVHIQEMDGTYLGTGNAVNDFVKTFQVLHDLNYAGWISLEVFDFTPGGQVIAQESMKTLRQIEAKLA